MQGVPDMVFVRATEDGLTKHWVFYFSNLPPLLKLSWYNCLAQVAVWRQQVFSLLIQVIVGICLKVEFVIL
jgi:hypothetical protein